MPPVPKPQKKPLTQTNFGNKKRRPIHKISDRQALEIAERSRLKRELIEQYGERCMKCGSKGDFRGLAIHHKVKLSEGGKTEKSNLILLCGKCHSLAHGITEYEEYIGGSHE